VSELSHERNGGASARQSGGRDDHQSDEPVPAFPAPNVALHRRPQVGAHPCEVLIDRAHGVSESRVLRNACRPSDTCLRAVTGVHASRLRLRVVDELSYEEIAIDEVGLLDAAAAGPRHRVARIAVIELGEGVGVAVRGADELGVGAV
jgi:hypothetical protein